VEYGTVDGDAEVGSPGGAPAWGWTPVQFARKRRDRDSLTLRQLPSTVPRVPGSGQDSLERHEIGIDEQGRMDKDTAGPDPRRDPAELSSTHEQSAPGRLGRDPESPNGRRERLEHGAVQSLESTAEPLDTWMVARGHEADVEIASVMVDGPASGEAAVHRDAEPVGGSEIHLRADQLETAHDDAPVVAPEPNSRLRAGSSGKGLVDRKVVPRLAPAVVSDEPERRIDHRSLSPAKVP
jgi:hypothetical protein